LAVARSTSDWLRLPAAAALAGVTPAVLRRRADAGELPCFRRGSGPRYFRTRDLAAWRDADPEQGVPLVFDRRSTTSPDSLREGLYDLILRLSPAFDLRETVDLLADGLRELVDAADCDIWMPEGEHLRCVVCNDVQGFDRACTGRILPLDRFPLTRRSVESTQPLAVDSLDDEALTEAEREAMRGWGLASLLDIPMVLGGSLVGLIELYDIVPRDFSDLRSAFEGSGQLLAGAFAKAALLDRLEQSNTELRHQNRRLSSLLDSGRAITSSSRTCSPRWRAGRLRPSTRPSASSTSSTSTRAP